MEHEQQYVGIDLHRRRSVIVRMNDAGEVLAVSKIDNDPVALAMAVAEAGPDPEVALEACYGWYWAADLLQAEGARVHLVHPLGLHWDTRRVKNDVKDATELANRLRRNDVPEAWIAPPEVRELRELVRYRAKLTALSDLGQSAGACGDGQAGHPARPWPTCSARAASGCSMRWTSPAPTGCGWSRCGTCSRSSTGRSPWSNGRSHRWLKDDPGYRAIQALHGIGPITAAILVAEIGDVHRFPTARHLCSWAGHDPQVARVRHHLPSGAASPRWHVARAAHRGPVRCPREVTVTIIGGLDIHRAQLTFDYVDTATGEVRTGRVAPANRELLRKWLERFDGMGEVEFVLEGCTGWRYVVEEMVGAGVSAHVAEPAETAALRGKKSRAKTDRADARHLRQLLADGRVPESWIPPAEVLDARVLVRLYKDLIDERTGWLQRVHATLVPSRRSCGGREPDDQSRSRASGLGRAAPGGSLRARRWDAPGRAAHRRDAASAPADHCPRGLASRAAKRCSATTGSGHCCRWLSGKNSVIAAASPAPTTPCATPAWT